MYFHDCRRHIQQASGPEGLPGSGGWLEMARRVVSPMMMGCWKGCHG